jgi:hypothetical protein
MSVDQSSANPAKLARYSANGLAMLVTLRARAETVETTLGTLSRSSSEHVPRLGGVDQDMLDLVGDWEHLDTFAGAVARAFMLAGTGPRGVGAARYDGTITIDGDVLGALGRVGLACRDEAIAAARDAAARLDELRDGRTVTLDDVEAFVALVARGRYDPAFAVTFSEEIGVAGYVDAVAIIRGAHQQTTIFDPVPAEGIAAVHVLATTLTTALHVPVGDSDSGDADRTLDQAFVDDLTSDVDPLDGQVNTDRPLRLEPDLSVLLRFTDPPTELAVAIAGGRLTPLLRDPRTLDVRDGGERWGAHGGQITNYATMLGRNADASALWLDEPGADDDRNIDLVLARNPGHPDHGHSRDLDEGRALAHVVRNGLTTSNPALTAPDPDVSDRHIELPIREILLERAVEATGHQDEIRNPFLHDAFAAGVEHSPNVIDTMVNENWRGGAPGGEPLTSEVHLAHDFLREVMGDDGAAGRVRVALYEQAQQQMTTLPADEDAATERYERTGRTLGVLTMADANVDVEAVAQRLARQADAGGAVDYALGWVPYVGQASDIADDILRNGAGSMIFGSGDPMDEGMEAVRPHIDRMDVNMAGLAAVSLYESGGLSEQEIIAASGIDFFEGQPGGHPGDADRRIKPLHQMTDEELAAFRRWANDVTTSGVSGRQEFHALAYGSSSTALRLQMRT